MNAKAEVDSDIGMESESTVIKTTLGAKLRTARTEKGLSRQDIANSLNLKPAVVVALEEGNYDDLPEMAYVRGYVRGYARLVGLGESEVLDYFPELQVSNTASARVGSRFKPRASVARRRYPGQAGLWIVVVFALVVALGWWMIGNGIKSPSSLMAKFEQSGGADSAPPTAAGDAGEDPALAPQNGVSSQIIINNFGEESSVRSAPGSERGQSAERGQPAFDSGQTVITLSPPGGPEPGQADGNPQPGVNVVREVTTFPGGNTSTRQ